MNATSMLVAWLAGFGWLVAWLPGRLASWLPGRLPGWLVAWLPLTIDKDVNRGSPRNSLGYWVVSNL